MNNILISKTPLRISFFGGGTDFENYFIKNKYGAVISCAINKFIYVTIKKHSNLFNEKYRLNYSETEEVNSISKINNSIIKECIKNSKIKDNLYISTIADVPGSSGLGSSSSFCVGLINVLNKYQGMSISKEKLAKLAINVEVDKLKKPIGIQDHFPPVYGGLNYFKFLDNRKVLKKTIFIDNYFKNKIFNNLVFFWTGVSRLSEDVLLEQKNNNHSNINNLNKIKDITDYVYKKIINKTLNIDEFGYLLNESWIIKKRLSSKVSNDKINEAYELGIKSGALGGKILGAGNGGFLIFSCKEKNRLNLIKNLKKINAKNIDFKPYERGSEIILKS